MARQLRAGSEFRGQQDTHLHDLLVFWFNSSTMMRMDQQLSKDETLWSQYYALEGSHRDHAWHRSTMIRGVYERMFPRPARKLVSIEDRMRSPPHQVTPLSSLFRPPNNNGKAPASRQFLFLFSSSKLVPLILSSYLILSVYYLLSVDPVRMAAHAHSFSRSSRVVTEADESTSPLASITINSTTIYSKKDTPHSTANPHPHIPNVLIFTHSENLLAYESLHNGSSSAALERELHVLAANVRHTVELHNDAAVRFLTDDDCEEVMVRAFPDLPHLSVHFRRESTGMYKADLCRGAALYEMGGIYVDVDVGVRMRLWDALDEDTTFATVRVHRQSAHPGSFFQAFVAVSPRHPIIRRYVELFDEYYRGKLPQYKGKPLGVVLLKRAFDDAVARDASLEASVELWQEVLYRFEWQHTHFKNVPPPTWGTRRACKFVVVSSMDPLVVPLYSRVAGSRMCPSNVSTWALPSPQPMLS